jgi:hypothetical protein
VPPEGRNSRIIASLQQDRLAVHESERPDLPLFTIHRFCQSCRNSEVELPPTVLAFDALKFHRVAHRATIHLGIYIVNQKSTVGRPRKAGISIAQKESAEGAALDELLFVKCRAFGAHSMEISNHGLTAVAIT